MLEPYGLCGDKVLCVWCCLSIPGITVSFFVTWEVFNERVGNTFTWLPVGGLENGWVGTVWFLLTVFVCACQSSCLEPSSSLYVLEFDCDVDGLLKYLINAQWKMFGDWLRTAKQHSLLHPWSGFIDIKSLHPHWNTAVIWFYGFQEIIEKWNHFSVNRLTLHWNCVIVHTESQLWKHKARLVINGCVWKKTLIAAVICDVSTGEKSAELFMMH